MNSNRRIRILPYRRGSKSAKALAEALGGKLIRLDNSRYKPRESDVIINWGNSSFGTSLDTVGTFKNHPELIHRASNKLTFFQMMEDYDFQDIIPRFFTSVDDIPSDAYPIVCRTVLNGHSGEGIVIANTPEELVPEAPLYIEYIKKQDEYRIHVGRKEDNTFTIISVQRKARRTSVEDEDVNWQVRNLQNGFVFVREGVEPPAAVLTAAEKALEATGLDFGAVDIIWNNHLQKAYVLELNSAPGISGTTIEDYKKFFLEGLDNA